MKEEFYSLTVQKAQIGVESFHNTWTSALASLPQCLAKTSRRLRPPTSLHGRGRGHDTAGDQDPRRWSQSAFVSLCLSFLLCKMQMKIIYMSKSCGGS